MADDFERRHRDQAVYWAARGQMRPVTYALRCNGMGCKKVLTASVGTRDHLYERNTTPQRLARRAVKEGWDTDSAGALACPACMGRLKERG